MNRLASVVMQNSHTVTLQLQQQKNCKGCPSNCNEPLIKLFSLKSNRFKLSLNDNQYTLIDADNLLDEQLVKGQMLALKIDDSDLLTSSAVFYFFPLLLCLIGVVVGHFFAIMFSLNPDLTALFGLVSGLLLVVYLFRNKRFKKYLKFRPKVTILRV